LGPENEMTIGMSSVDSVTLLLQKLPLNKAPDPDFASAEHLLCAGAGLPI